MFNSMTSDTRISLCTSPVDMRKSFNGLIGILVTETFYDADTGRAFRIVDPAAKDHRTFFDAMSRTTKTIANYVTGTPTITYPDRDVTVEMTYHPSGQVATMTAKNATTGDQVTRYVYGTTKTSVAPIIYRNDLLVAEIYPDSDNFESGGILQNGPSGVADRVEFQYNRTGEQIQRKDQNGSIHVYELDNLGRVLHDRVTTLGTGVDGAVRRISTAYDVIGNVKSLTSFNNATVGTGNVVNEVKYEFDANGLLAKEFQNPSGAVNTSTSLYTGYTYDTTKSGDFFTKRLRQTSLRYPSATMINYTYGTSGSVDDLLNRFTEVKNGATSVAQYVDSGLATPMKVTYPQPGLTLDYTASGALDRFGRITDHAWKNAGGTALVQIKHGYDRVGNRLYREDVVAANNSKNFDELYSYDGVNQLVDMQRGKLNTAKNGIASGKNYQDNFAFDATGNWSTYKQDTTGAGFSLTQARTHNKANEVLTIAGATTNVAHDLNGNMTTYVLPNNWAAAFPLMVYDAWNRLVSISDGKIVYGTYSYDGLNRRVKKIVGAETRLFYFNNAWQCLEEYIGSDICNVRYVWGLRYIDDLVTYRNGSTDYLALQDPNWNVVALTNTAGVAQERYTYSAFGKVNFFDAAFNVRSATAVSITRTFTGQRFDYETGLMLYRNRVYHPTLGRFLQRDPIGYSAGDVGLYRYVGNNPQVSIDSTGLFLITCHCSGRLWGNKDVKVSHSWCNGRLATNCCADACGSHGLRCNGFDLANTQTAHFDVLQAIRQHLPIRVQPVYFDARVAVIPLAPPAGTIEVILFLEGDVSHCCKGGGQIGLFFHGSAGVEVSGGMGTSIGGNSGIVHGKGNWGRPRNDGQPNASAGKTYYREKDTKRMYGLTPPRVGAKDYANRAITRGKFGGEVFGSLPPCPSDISGDLVGRVGISGFISGGVGRLSMGGQFDVPVGELSLRNGLSLTIDQSSAGVVYGLGTGARIQVYGRGYGEIVIPIL